MRNIYILQETHDDAVKLANTYFKILNNKELYKTAEKTSDTNIKCGSYEIQFLSRRQWDAKGNTAPQSGYLTIPYNRFLLSTNGVKSENCNLKGLQKLLIDEKSGEAK